MIRASNVIKRVGRPKGQGPHGEPTKPMRIPVSLLPQVTQFIKTKSFKLPFYSCKVSAGFPSPADDYLDTALDLNEHLIKHPAATFFVRAIGNSMIQAGIFDNDILIVDRSLEPIHGKIVIAVIAGELTVKRFYKKGQTIELHAENPDYPAILIKTSDKFMIWGVVTHVIHTP